MSSNTKTMVELSAVDKRALLTELLRKKAHAPKSFPMSFAQQRLWFLDQLEPGNRLYNIPLAVKLLGRLDVGLLQQSLNEVIRRHEVLRTTFAMIDHQPVQIIAPDLSLTLPVIDLRGLPDAKTEARRLTQDEARRPFDLARGPLIRAKLLRLTTEEHIALLTMHHIISDGWSMNVLVRELTTLYTAYLKDMRSPLPELPIQYVDFAQWQRRWLSNEVLEKQLSYWKRQLADTPVLQLPIDHARPAIQTFNGARHTLALPKSLSDALNGMSRRQGVTLFMTLLSAWQVLLSRYSGQSDVSVGLPIAGRNRLETEALIGFFINTLVMRTDLSGDPAFSEVLRRVKEMTLDAHAHQDIPFEKVVEELQPERSLSYTPLFQAAFILQNISPPSVDLPGLSIKGLDNESVTAKFDLMLTMDEDNGLIAAFDYNTDLFEAATIERLARHFQTLLEGIVNNPDARISELPLLTTEEKVQLLHWNRRTSAFPRDKCIHELFEEQAQRTPDQLAVIFGEAHLTYGELNERANRLAHYLQSLGVGPEVTVALCLERSLDLIVGLLGILKAGGVYLPLDPQYPIERLAFMLEDGAALVLLTQEHLLDVLPTHWSQVVCLDSDWELIEAQGGENVKSIAGPENLAYVMYTSGSTGKAKGVSVTHRNVVRLVKENDYADFSPKEVFLQLAPISFDASTFEIWGSLLNGARLVVMNPGVPTFAELGRELRRHNITTLWLTAGLLHLMVDERLEDLAGLRQLLAGGDCLSVPHVKRVLDELEGVRVINGYGPTETTTFACCYPMDDAGDMGVTVPIGRPIANTEVYVLDDTMGQVPVGVVGELHIGGEGLARGYLNRPELTAERFVPHPFGQETGTRLYRTGDRARYLPDGRLEFLGRTDNQVKLRGFRIELGEVESVLGRHGAISECVVIAREDAPGDKRLVAYAVTAAESEISAGELRDYLREKLPEYMVPSAVILLNELPLTSNGKVDRRALPAPNDVQQEERSYLAPRTPIEEMLAGIWAEVLGRERIGVDDDFFDLGGHSLLATQLMSRVRDALKVEIGLRQLFDTPTVRDFAVAVEEAQREGQGLSAPPILPVSRAQALPLSFAQQRLWFLDQFEPDSSLYNLPLALRLTGDLQLSVLERTLNEIVRRHEVLRTTFAVEDGAPIQTIAPSLTLPLPVIDLTALPADVREAEATRLAREEARRPFDLSKGPLVRATLLRLSEQEHVGLFTLHHIVSDGWSSGVLFKEVAMLSEAFSDGRPSPLRDLSIQYADFAYWQRQWLAGDILEKQLSYWRRQLGGAPAMLELPTDRPRPVAQTFNGDCLSVTLSAELTQALKELSLREQVTLFMTLLAGFKTMLSRYTGQQDIVVGTPIANRNRRETEELIGFFVNTIALRTDLTGNPTFNELLVRVREAALGAYAHQDVPFEKLVEDLQPERNLSHSPLFQVFFALQNAPQSSLKLPALELEGFEFDGKSSKFDLSLYITEADGRLELSFEYNTDLFDSTTIGRMAGYYQTLLTGIVADPNSAISDLPLLDGSEQNQLLAKWNDTSLAYPQTCAYRLFEKQVELMPEAVALTFENRGLTYIDLNERANQLARYLQKHGVGPESLVAIFVDRSPEMVVALMGVMKAGAAYLPLDTQFPRERLTIMLDDAKPSILLTQQHLLRELGNCSANVIALDLDHDLIAQEDADNLPETADLGNLAYVIYTSGSTGRPKGVQITHQALVNFLFSMQKKPGLNPEDVLLSVTTLSFDIAGLEIYLPLIVGARIVLASREVAMDGRLLTERLNTSGATTLQATPATWSLLIDSGWRGNSSLKILCGGEALPQTLAEHLLERGGALWNLYGPTETTIWSTLCRIEKGNPVNVGKPLANTQTYILNDRLQMVPPGIAGQLYIGGDGLARGYWQRPELTADRFIPDPFGTRPGGRLYKTGDLARYLADGNIDIIGRTDHQVKVRGYRIELGEIESTLSKSPLVGQSVVAAMETSPGNKGLVAYLVPKLPESLTDGSHSELQLEQVSAWQTVWDQTYSQRSQLSDPSFNLSGWNSSYTGLSVPAEEMRQWVEHTVDQILSLKPNRVLEIGCGSGLLLFKIAPHCHKYIGTELSQASLQYLGEQLKSATPELPQVELRACAATGIEDVAALSVDTVILNSVIQYFPDVSYLLRVIELAAQKVGPGGAIFIGDVRSLPLLETFHASVQLHQAPAALSRAALAQRVRKCVAEEKELVIDPDLFTALPKRLPQINKVEVRVKRGHYHNELTRFRYDVVLRIGCDEPAILDLPTIDWQRQDFDLELLRRFLEEDKPDTVVITRVPNARLLAEVQAHAMIADSDGPETAGEIRANLREMVDNSGIDPEDLWALGDQLSYAVDIAWAGSDPTGSLTVTFTRRVRSHSGSVHSGPAAMAHIFKEPATGKPIEQLANNPLQRKLHNSLVTDLREQLRRSLPEYMVPAAFVVLKDLPRTPNGKIDRKRLPAPELGRERLEQSYVAPRNAVEVTLAAIWEDVLRVAQVGVHDNFFELGGHSLLATQLVSRVRHTFEVEIPLRELFERPTVKGLSQAIERARLSSNDEFSAPPLLPVSRDQRLPLSFAQERLWFLDQLEPGSVSYNMPAAARLTGKLDGVAIQAALNEIVQRHEVLRTSFTTVDGEPEQVIAPELTLAFPVLDLASLPTGEREAKATQLAREEAECPFDLSRGPLLRATLLRLSDEDHILLLTMHHIISDGWSMGILIKEVTALYQAFAAGQPSPLPEPTIQYADYALWQRKWLQGAVLENQIEYWKRQLAGVDSLDLPMDRPRPPARTFNGANYNFELPPALRDAISALSRREGTTLFMTFLAAFHTLLHRYTNQENISIGTPIAGRTRLETESLIGFFVNTLVLHAQLNSNDSFSEVLRSVREITLQAHAHQDVPFEKLVEELQPERDLSRTPLFQVMFTLRNLSAPQINLSDLTVQPFGAEGATAKFDLHLGIEERENGVSASFEYNTDLFNASTIERLAEHFQILLEGIVRNPDCQLAQLPLLTEGERHQLLHEWNETEADYSGDTCIHELFEAQVGRTPDAVALVHEDQEVTYRELNERANQLARHLQSLGVTPDSLVGICVPRSIEMIVGLLGILKAGGAYLPLDPQYPQERLALILEDADVRILLTEQQLVDQLPEHIASVICLDSDWEQIAKQSTAQPSSQLTPQHLAYVIYTSGSTGRPKGVMITHQNLSRLLAATQHRFNFTEQDVWTMFHSYAFDFSVWELWGALTYGGRLVLVPYWVSRSPSDFYELLVREQVTVLNQTPSAFQQLLRVDERRCLNQAGAGTIDREDRLALRAVIFGGEALEMSSLRRWFERHGNERPQLVNMYGITETTVHVTYRELHEQDTSGGSVIGRAIDDLAVYVLGKAMALMPVGVSGELYVGGAGLARGYLHRPDLTAERFVPDPFSQQPGARLYRTGDVVRWSTDGDLEYVGRIDNQVKVRGFRIELGEIEAALSTHEAVDECVVVVKENTPGDKRLVAYAVLRKDAEIEAGQLRRHVGAMLPEYMTPSTFVVLDKLPLTSNGKVDRKRLPAAELDRGGLEHSYVAPRTEVEATLATIWEDVLQVEQVGVADNFFELGGHSLLAVRLFAQIERRLGTKLPVATLFRAPTVAQLATHLRQQSANSTQSTLIKIQSGDDHLPALFFVHPVGGNILSYGPMTKHLDPAQPFYAFQSPALVGEPLRNIEIESLAARYVEELRTLQPEGPYLLGGWSMGGVIAFEMARQLDWQNQQVPLLALLDSHGPGPDDLLAAEEDEITILTSFAQDMGLSLDGLTVSMNRLLELDADDQLAYVLNEVKIAGIIHPDVSFDQIRLLYQVFKSNLRASRSYAPQPYSGRITLFKAEDQFETTSQDSTNGWDRLAAAGVDVHLVPGNHYTMMREPHLAKLVEELKTSLYETVTG